MKPAYQVILVPHPGKEASAGKDGTCPWPPDNKCQSGKHSRKFLKASGEWYSSKKGKGSGGLAFWGEYEGPTKTKKLISNGEKDCPQYIHSIDKVVSDGYGMLNTDPWIFSPGFVWSICRRTTSRNTYSAGDLHIGRGNPPTIVLFGSVVSGRWLLDTVLAAKDEVDFDRLCKNRAFETMVSNPLGQMTSKLKPIVGHPFRSFKEPFSFTPARPIQSHADVAFSRPDISHLFEKLTLVKGKKKPSTFNSQSRARCSAGPDFWNQLVTTVEGQNLVLATQIEFPSGTFPKSP